MSVYLVPGYGYVQDTGIGVFPLPGFGYIQEAQVTTTNVAPGAGVLTLVGSPPTVTQEAGGSVAIGGAGVLTLVGSAPSLTFGITIGADSEAFGVSGELTLTGRAPRVQNQAYDSAGRGGAAFVLYRRGRR